MCPGASEKSFWEPYRALWDPRSEIPGGTHNLSLFDHRKGRQDTKFWGGLPEGITLDFRPVSRAAYGRLSRSRIRSLGRGLGTCRRQKDSRGISTADLETLHKRNCRLA